MYFVLSLPFPNVLLTSTAEVKKMIGAIAGDIIGSFYEAYPIKKKEFPLFGVSR